MNTPTSVDHEPVEVPLKDAAWAALLAWLVPGAGHFYQRRYAKGAIFSLCILGTFFTGLVLGDGQVVYASWRPNDYRWQYFCQLGVGLPAVPAIVQNIKTRQGADPLFPNRAFIIDDAGVVSAEVELEIPRARKTAYYAPPPGPIPTNDRCVLGIWHEEMQGLFEIGTLYTVVAGLLNLLAVYDAFAGPAFPGEDKKSEEDDEADEAHDS